MCNHSCIRQELACYTDPISSTRRVETAACKRMIQAYYAYKSINAGGSGAVAGICEDSEPANYGKTLSQGAVWCLCMCRAAGLRFLCLLEGLSFKQLTWANQAFLQQNTCSHASCANEDGCLPQSLPISSSECGCVLATQRSGWAPAEQPVRFHDQQCHQHFTAPRS